MKKFYTRKSLQILSVIFVLGMVFGIGNEITQAATPTVAAQTHEQESTVAAEQEAGSTHEATAEEDQGVVGLLGLNWKLFIAQLINFGIVLFVLWKWVFGPVAKGLSNRTAKIEASLEEAQKIAEERQTFDSWKNGEIAEVRKEAAGILTKAKAEAESLKTDMISQTKEEQNKLVSQTQVQLEQEKQNIVKEAKAELADLVVNATQAVIKAKLDPKKDAELIKQALAEAGAK